MKKRKLLVFTGTSRAAEYGIGTYLNQLIDLLIVSDIDFDIVYLYAKGSEVEVIDNDHYTTINIPLPRNRSEVGIGLTLLSLNNKRYRRWVDLFSNWLL